MHIHTDEGGPKFRSFWSRVEVGNCADFRKMEYPRGGIEERCNAVYGDSCSSMPTVKNWFTDFRQCGRRSIFDEQRRGAPVTGHRSTNSY